MNLLRRKKKFIVVLIGAILLTPLLPRIGHTEIYLGGMGGYVAPMDLSDISATTGSGPTLRLNDAAFKGAAMAGGKVGYYFSSVKWLGIEMEGMFTTLLFKDQGQDASSGNLVGADSFEVTTWGINVIFRYPGERFQPYLGAGLGVFAAELTLDTFGTASQGLVPGINALAGIRAFLNDAKSVAAFVEYKYNYAQFEFSYPPASGLPAFQVDATYSANIAAAGVTVHFDIFPGSIL